MLCSEIHTHGVTDCFMW